MTETHLRSMPDDPDAAGLTQPHNDDYERMVLGTTMLYPAVITELRDEGLTSTTFYRHAHELIWNATLTLAVTNRPIDAATVADELTRRGNLKRAGGRPYLHELIATVTTPGSATYYATRLTQLQAQRRDDTLATQLQQIAHSLDENAHELTLSLLRDHLEDDQHFTANRVDLPGQDVDTFLGDGANDDHYDWLVPGMLERQDRLILTAGEGHGKSTLLRQWAMQVAVGTHPFTLEPCTPHKVLYLDLENSERQTRRKMRQLRLAAGKDLNPDNLVIACKVEGLNLSNPDDQAWLAALIAHHTPDLLITGPIYKLANGDPISEAESKPAALAIDALRARHDLAVILEAHTAKSPNGNPKNRPKEPYGWSGWLRWPEFGLHLSKDGDLTHWRGMREEREFPEALQRGGKWPWTSANSENDNRWYAIRNTITAAGKKLTDREISDATLIPRSTVQRIMSARQNELTSLVYSFGIED